VAEARTLVAAAETMAAQMLQTTLGVDPEVQRIAAEARAVVAAAMAEAGIGSSLEEACMVGRCWLTPLGFSA